MSDWGGCTGACPSSPQLQLFQTMIFATPVLLAFLLLLIFCFHFQRRSRAATLHSQINAQLFEEGVLATAHLEQGLSISFRQKLPIILFDDKFKSTCRDTQCVVCLGDYQLNEKLQQLPVCNHLFHLSCIDEWLAENATCPICRLSFSDITDPLQTHEACRSVHADATRTWEEMVVNEAQTLQIGPTTSSEDSMQHEAALSEHDDRRARDYMINIERS